MRLADLVATSLEVGGTRSRKKKLAHLATCLRDLAADEVEIGVAFLAGEIRQGKIGLGWAAVRDVSAPAADTDTLTLHEVDRAFADIQAITGKGSKAAREKQLYELLARATADEQHFLGRLIVGELRQGALAGLLTEAIALAAEVDSARVRRAVMLSGELGAVARAALSEGEPGLAGFHLELFRPLKPMLAQTAEDPSAALARVEACALEYKLDGARVQVHKRDDDVRVFTRRLHDVTASVPEVVESVRELPARSLVLDGEAIAFGANGRPLPFQVTMRRFGRRLDVARLRAELPLDVRFFDVLHRDGDDVLDLDVERRLPVLDEIVPAALRVPRRVTRDEDEADAFFAAALEAGHEGLVAKALASTYEAGRRGAGWLKIKPAHTLDLVVLAAEWGSGRRKGWLSNLHLGARDPRGGGFVMLGKTFKGLTDERLRWQTERFLELELTRDAHTVFVKPEVVVEVAFDGVQESPHYPGGVALRFARVKRYRKEKLASDADTIDAVRELYERSR